MDTKALFRSLRTIYVGIGGGLKGIFSATAKAEAIRRGFFPSHYVAVSVDTLCDAKFVEMSNPDDMQPIKELEITWRQVESDGHDLLFPSSKWRHKAGLLLRFGSKQSALFPDAGIRYLVDRIRVDRVLASQNTLYASVFNFTKDYFTFFSSKDDSFTKDHELFRAYMRAAIRIPAVTAPEKIDENEWFDGFLFEPMFQTLVSQLSDSNVIFVFLNESATAAQHKKNQAMYYYFPAIYSSFRKRENMRTLHKFLDLNRDFHVFDYGFEAEDNPIVKESLFYSRFTTPRDEKKPKKWIVFVSPRLCIPTLSAIRFNKKNRDLSVMRDHAKQHMNTILDRFADTLSREI